MSGSSGSPKTTEELLKRIKELEAEVAKLRARLINTWGEG